MATPPDPSCPPEVLKLIERFDANKDHYKAPAYKEAQVRQEFVNPLFKALGWDVDNTKDRAEAYKEVVHEDSLQIQGRAKAPDYAFKVGAQRKFFVETKKPSVNVKMHAESAFQLRRYARSAKLPLSILTDFEEFAVYDTRVRPLKSDSPSKARVLYITYDEYEKRWPEIASVFSREAIYRGAFDKFAESKKKRGTTEVDDDFLDTIREWRELLAKDIFKNNDLSERQLNRDVQAIIDRIIFLRICEDRGVEDFGRLLKLKPQSPIYPQLVGLFRAADDRYNSGLFHFKDEKNRPSQPDTSTPNLTVSDRVLKRIIDDVYYPSQYEFRVFPPDVLGQVYERFLGDVISVSQTGKSVKIEPKPEVRKAGGVYYTPTYIVDYIVKHTVGELVKDKPPHEVAGRTKKQFKPAKGAHPVRVLDPACGSGSFLLGAYQFLLDWFRNEYTKDTKRWTSGPDPTLWQAADNDFRLTIAERKRILTDHIYGVDIDRQAVEVTKLSLLLKCLEGESSDSIGAHLFHMKERALPDLAANIKCGNSLIGSDFYDGKDADEFTLEDRMRINAFDWKQEFSQALADGGFDVVIGNPPYRKEKNAKDDFELLRKSSIKRYCQGKMDLWYAFACQSLDLTRAGGSHAFIATNTWFASEGATILRAKIQSESTVHRIVDFGDLKIFKDASVQTMIYTVERTMNRKKYSFPFTRVILDSGTNPSPVVIEDWINDSAQYERASISSTTGSPIRLADLRTSAIRDKSLKRFDRIGKNNVFSGMDVLQERVTQRHLNNGLTNAQVGNGIFVVTKKEAAKICLTPDDQRKMRPYYTTNQLGRYFASPDSDEYVVYADQEVRESPSAFPGIKAHLDRFESILTSDFAPYGMHRTRDEAVFSANAIYSIRKTQRPAFAVAEFPCFVSRAFLVILPGKPTELLHLTASVLNSKFGHFWLAYFGKKQGNQLQVDVNPVAGLPVPRLDNSDSDHRKLSSLSSTMHKLSSQQTRDPDERRILQQQIDATDREIDRLVNKLYELTDEEIAIVEAATAPAETAP